MVAALTAALELARVVRGGTQVRRIGQSPNYPVQLMPAVFDFPGEATEAGEAPVAELIVSHVRGS